MGMGWDLGFGEGLRWRKGRREGGKGGVKEGVKEGGGEEDLKMTQEGRERRGGEE